MKQPELSIIVPCYNEEKNIPLILNRFKEAIGKRKDIELILVNNGSTDNSFKIIKKMLPNYTFTKTFFIRINQGYGFGVYSGLLTAKGEYLCWTHADMQTDPKDAIEALNIIKKQENPEKTFVKGKRKGRPLFDSIFTLGMSTFESIFFRRIMYDINAQPNLFHKSLLKKIKNPPKDFSFDLYFYYIAKKLEYKIKRFGVFFPKRLHGESHWNTSIKNKLRFIKRTILYSIKLKRFKW